jgi:LacI family transcriptional regulator
VDQNRVVTKKESRTATIRDVAQLAGVSTATVSKVVNNIPYVSDDTRQQVLDAISQLNYHTNTIARGLRKSKTATIGLITDDIEGVFTMAMMRGVEEIASARGSHVFLCNSYGDMEREREHLQALLAKQVDGIILMSGYRVQQRAAPALDIGDVPVAYLYQYTADLAAPCIVPDDYGGGALGTRHLIELGRRRVAFINGPEHFEATHARLKGYRDALEQGGLAFDPALVRAGKWNQRSGYTLTHDLMAQADPPDALFCASDSLAAGAIDALHELGRQIPHDVAVVGFDNRYFSAYQRPPLTTVALPLYEMGVLAAEMLMEPATQPRQQREMFSVDCSLVVRQSCGAALT